MMEFRSIPVFWKLVAATVALVLLIAAGSGISNYFQQRQADEAVANLARISAQNAEQARIRAQQYKAEVAAHLSRQRTDLYNNYQQINDQARQNKAEQAVKLQRQREEQARLQASYVLGPSQTCVGGAVITRHDSAFTQTIGRDGKPISCSGRTASEPLR
jgi:signal transduction histidine kinase